MTKDKDQPKSELIRPSEKDIVSDDSLHPISKREDLGKPKQWAVFSRIDADRKRAATADVQAGEELIEARIDYLKTEKKAERIDDILKAHEASIEGDLITEYNRLSDIQAEHEDKGLERDISRKEKELRLKELDEQLNPPEVKKETPEEAEEELKRQRGISQAKSRDWADRTVFNATNKHDVIFRLERACLDELKKLEEDAKREDWSYAVYEDRARHIKARFENEKNKVD